MTDTVPTTGPEPPPANEADYGANGGTKVAALWPGETSYREPPVNYEAEQALLAAILENNHAYDRVADFLRPEHFVDRVHGDIFEAAGKLIERGQQANAITLKIYFDRDEDLAEVGGAQYLVRLQSSVVTIVNAADYGTTILDLYRRREAIASAETTIEELYDVDLDRPAEKIIEDSQTGLDAILGAGDRGGLEPIGTRVAAALEQIEGAYKAQGTGAAGLCTGLKSLDKLIGGLKPGKVYVVAGATAMGKSSMAENISFVVARSGQRPAFFSLEMTAEDVIQREISRITGIDSKNINNGWLSEPEMDQVIACREALTALPLHIDDTSTISVAGIRARARRMQRAGGLDLVVIDYLQLMGDDRRPHGMQRYEEIGQMTRQIKTGIAKELRVPVILLSQLSRQVDSRDDHRPRLPDLRESGSIEQDADVVMFLYREEYYLKNEKPQRRGNETDETFERRERTWYTRLEDKRSKAEIIVAKQRNGPTGSVAVEFDGPRMRFHEGEAESQENQEEIPF